MIIGIPRERKQGESRVVLTPQAVETLVKTNSEVIIETNAGLLSGFEDDEFRNSGATIVNELEELWARSELLLKVKEPAEEERAFFREDLTIFSFLHPAADKDLVEQLVSSKATGLDFDLVSEQPGNFPILSPMSEIAGALSVYSGFQCLQPSRGGRGVLLGGLEGIEPASILIIGAGVAGKAAAETAIATGAKVCILDIKESSLEQFQNRGSKVRALISAKDVIKEEVAKADIVIGAVLVPGDKAPKLVSKELLKNFRKGAALVDICIDQGGFAETSRSTSIKEPTYIEQDVVHYCVPNMPALVPRTSTMAISRAVLPWVSILAKQGVYKALENSKGIKNSLITSNGKLVNNIVKDALGF